MIRHLQPSTLRALGIVLGLVISGWFSLTAPAAAIQSPIADLDYSQMTLVDAVNCATDTSHDFLEYPANISSVQTILGQQCRTLPNDSGDAKYFAYRIGKELGLEANRNYFLRIIYPGDQPRTMFILNRGAETTRGFHTGITLGDGAKVPYVNTNVESLDLPLSGVYESWATLFRLQERYPDLKFPRNVGEFPRDQTPSDGFLVICLQLSPVNAPLSAGVAIQRIELYEAPPISEITAPSATLPAGLPVRHLFWREEMADGVIGSTNPDLRGFDDDMSWYEGKFDLMKFLGMHTFSKDLLEFGHNQGWDPAKYGGGNWVNQSATPERWSRIVRRCGELGFAVLPMYEYAGSRGPNGLGDEKRAEPLSTAARARGTYTQIGWAEAGNVDITDPDSYEDLRRILDITITEEQEHAHFAGAWIRNRVADMPISFSDATLARFESETNQASTVTRSRLENESSLYETYILWWNDKRNAYFAALKDYLRSSVHSEMDVMYTFDSTESGLPRVSPHGGNVVAETPSLWNDTGLTVKSLADALTGHWQLEALTSDKLNWGTYEWPHGEPNADPLNYHDTPGVYLTSTLNRAYTTDPVLFDAFRAQDGLAVIRHYSLNEDATTIDGDNRLLVGYFLSDVDYAGPFVMLPEALAMANGDPRYIGYLAGSHFNRGHPDFVRRFNANYLALPALPSTLSPEFSTDTDLVIRKITTPDNGIYLAAIHTGRTARHMTIQLPETGRVFDGVTDELLSEGNTLITLAMDPCELRTLRFFPASVSSPPDIIMETEFTAQWWDALELHNQWLTIPLTPRLVDHDADSTPETVLWSIESGNPANVRFGDPNKAQTEVAFNEPGTYVLRLSVTDGADTVTRDVTVHVKNKRHRLNVTPGMTTPLSEGLVDAGLFDNQDDVGEPPFRILPSNYQTTSIHYPMSTLVDLGQPTHITGIRLLDLESSGVFDIHAGSPTTSWSPIVSYSTQSYNKWKVFEVDVTTRYLKFDRTSEGAVVGEVVLYSNGGGTVSPGTDLTKPLVPELQRNVEGNTVNFFSRTNPFKTYELLENTTLGPAPWTPVDTWNSSEPFHTLAIPVNKPAAFYKIKESDAPQP